MSRAAMGCENCACDTPDEKPWRVVLYAPDGSVYEESAISEDRVTITDEDVTIKTDIPTDLDWDDDDDDVWEEVDTQPKLASFNAAAERTLGSAQNIHRQRGNAYRDSWALENQKTTFIDATLALIGSDPDSLSAAEKRLLMVASLVDVKDSRMAGDFHLDNVLDGINYRAAWGSWAEDYHGDVLDARRDVVTGRFA